MSGWVELFGYLAILEKEGSRICKDCVSSFIEDGRATHVTRYLIGCTQNFGKLELVRVSLLTLHGT